MKVYAKNSFDRFGDDLTEEILQYMTFEDKIRLECVSKQWRRLVFNKQFVIELNMNLEDNRYEKQNSLNKLIKVINYKSHVKHQSLESLLKKCPNITKVNFRRKVDSFTLSLIGRYCHRIKSLTYHLKAEDNALSFFRQYGHKLKELNLYLQHNVIEQYLRHCPNLKTVFIDDKSFRFPQDMEFLPKLERIKSNINLSSHLDYINDDSNDDFNDDYSGVMLIENLFLKYSRRLKTLNVTLNGLTAEEAKTSLEYISQFENLRELTLELLLSATIGPIDDCLSLIGQKCNKLLKLDLNIVYGIPITEQFFDIFYKLEDIRKLKISLAINTVLSGSVECFKHCKQLIELDITCNGLRENFFTNIASFLPKLQSLRIGCDKQFPDSFINSFYSMKSIKSVELSNKDKSKTKIWYFIERFH